MLGCLFEASSILAENSRNSNALSLWRSATFIARHLAARHDRSKNLRADMRARNYRLVAIDFRNLLGGLFHRSYRPSLSRETETIRSKAGTSDLICRFDRSWGLIDDVGGAIGFLMNVQRNVTNSAVKAPAISSCHCDISHVSPHEETYTRACTATLKAYFGLPRRVWPFKRARCANDAGNERDAARSRDCPLRSARIRFRISSLLLRRCVFRWFHR